MRKFKKVEETDDLLDELLEGIELVAQEEEEKEEEEAEVKDEKVKEKGIEKDSPDTFNPNGLTMVLERIDAGLIGSLRITGDKTNIPVIKKDDLIQLRKHNRLLVKDFVLYKIGEDYYIRRIIKFKGMDIYVAGDNEREYRIIHKEDVLAKVIGRERGKHYTSFGFNPKNKWYTFCKVNLAPIRLGNRVKSYEQDLNAESLEAAMQKMEEQAARAEVKLDGAQLIQTDVDLDSDLADFLDPNDLVKELRGEMPTPEAEEEIVYVDEYGNEISPNEEEDEEGEVVGYIEDGEFEAEGVVENEEAIEDESVDSEEAIEDIEQTTEETNE